MKIRPYTPEDRAATLAFSERLKLHNRTLSFEPLDHREEHRPDEPSHLQMIVASDDHGVQGGYTLRSDHYRLDGQQARLHYFGFPISAGVFDRTYAVLGLKLQRDIQKRVEYAYGLGGGGMQSQVNQLKIRGGWSACDVPFWLFLNRPARVLKRLPVLHQTRLLSAASNILGYSGLASLGGQAVRYLRSHGEASLANSIEYEIVAEFPSWVDSLYESCVSRYRLLARRDRCALETRFPQNLPHLQRGVVWRQGAPLGWFVVLDQVFNKQRHFGDLKVGVITDCLAAPEFAAEVIAAATDHLREARVDLVVCNASHSAWNSALKRSGYLKGPSNFPFLASPKLAAKLAPLGGFLAESHVVRADGDSVQAMLPARVSTRHHVTPPHARAEAA